MSDTTTATTAAAEIVSAYVGNNEIAANTLPDLIRAVAGALRDAENPPEPAQEPAVPIEKAVSGDKVTCLECGFSGQMLSAHVRRKHGLSPYDYLSKWGLPRTALVAPAYSARRSGIAKEIGLGHTRKKRSQSNA